MTVNTPEWQQLVGDGVVYEESRGVAETKALVAELCRHFYALGWLSGTGGSVSLKAHDQSIPVGDQLLVMSPSGVQKERMVGEDMYVVAPDGFVLSRPLRKPYPHKPPKCTDSAPLFIKVHKLCSAGAIIHSHGLDACLVTMINPSLKEFRISHMEMIKGVQGHCYGDELVVPIIENTARERELVESLTEAVLAYPRTTAVLVRNHGVYIWGDSWISAKTQAECYHYLFDAAIKLHQLGLDWPTPEHGPVGSVSVYGSGGGFGRDMSQEMKHSIVLDLEGTLTPTPPVYCSC